MATHLQDITTSLHGREVRYRLRRGADDAPVIMLVHGMAGSSAMWLDTMQAMDDRYTVIAPDLLGHGGSAKFRGDYSLGNQASLLRDLLVLLGHDKATFVGQSLGGGVVLQASYQYPQRMERLVLVDAGGLGREVALLLRLLALPGSGAVLNAATLPPVRFAIDVTRRVLRTVGLDLGPEQIQMMASFESLADEKTRKAFLATLRSVVDLGGQRVSAADRLYLAATVPTMVIWGDRDPIIPLDHGVALAETLPHARLEIFEQAGHFPQNQAPKRFAALLGDFIEGTEPADLSVDELRVLLGR